MMCVINNIKLKNTLKSSLLCLCTFSGFFGFYGFFITLFYRDNIILVCICFGLVVLSFIIIINCFDTRQSYNNHIQQSNINTNMQVNIDQLRSNIAEIEENTREYMDQITINIDNNIFNFNEYKKKYSENITLDNNVCSICLEVINNNYFCFKKCNHVYHNECLKTWLNIKKCCPNCRHNYP